MDINDLAKAIDYVEEHLSDHIDYGELAKYVYSSSYHLQKTFGVLCGITIGDYIRRRRLSLAGAELIKNKAKVIDLALKFDYETPESFSRAFYRFHGVLPSKVKSETVLKMYPRLSVKNCSYGVRKMECKITEKSEIVLLGYKRHFYGVPYGNERTKQENDFFCSTRAKQWLLIGAASSPETDYGIVTNVGDDGYDYHIAYEVDKWAMDNMFNSEIAGVDLSTWGLKVLVIPKQTYIVYSTDNAKYPIKMYSDLRQQIAQYLPSDFEFIDAPELVAYHWRTGKRKDWAHERHIEIYMPIKLKE